MKRTRILYTHTFLHKHSLRAWRLDVDLITSCSLDEADENPSRVQHELHPFTLETEEKASVTQHPHALTCNI